MHHAQLIIGDFDSSLSILSEEERVPGTDVSIEYFDTFGIGEARSLKESAALSPVARSQRLFVVGFATITTEAQNALLKLFEEPPETARFYIIAPQEEILIPTLRSRLFKIEGGTYAESGDAEGFLKQTIAERLAVIADMQKKKNIQWFDGVFQGVEQYIGTQGTPEEKQAVLFVRSYDRVRSASKKMLMEHLALSIKTIK